MGANSAGTSKNPLINDQIFDYLKRERITKIRLIGENIEGNSQENLEEKLETISVENDAKISQKDDNISENAHKSTVGSAGIISTYDQAQKLADTNGEDLVLVAPHANPPVCKIMDYSKYKFEQKKRDKEQRKTQKQTELKEIRVSSNIDVNDINTKASNAIKFLKAGDKVKISLKFKGREIVYRNLGLDSVQRIVNLCSDYGTPEGAILQEGKNMFVILNPQVKK